MNGSYIESTFLSYFYFFNLTFFNFINSFKS